MATPKSDARSGAPLLFSSGGASYELESSLGRGPFGEQLLLAVRRVPARAPERVMLKALPLGPAAAAPRQTLARARMEEEVRLGAYLHHPGIARVHGLHETPDALYLEVEHVPGFNLDDVAFLSLARQRFCSESFVVHVGLHVAEALAFAHARTDERGAPLAIVHRDLNPQRIRVSPQGEVKLTGFEVAASGLPGRVPSSITRPQGAAFYCAPEVLFDEAVDARADLFSLGLVLLELATGLHLYSLPRARMHELEERLTDKGHARVHRAIAVAMDAGLVVDDFEFTAIHAAAYQPEDLEQLVARLSPPLRALLHRLLQREPADRYATAEAVVAVLRAWRDTLPLYGSEDAAEEIHQALVGAGRELAESELRSVAPLQHHALRRGTRRIHS